MRNHRISLQDIATLAGVTKMTVSRYIRSPKKVAKETGERIAKIMEEINYIPNRAPGMLLNAQSYTLGILIPSFQNQLFADILAGIESVTSEHNYQTLIAKEGANKRGNSSRLTQSFHFFMFEPIFSPVNALNQPI